MIPCHRVVRTGGALGGYGFGLERKRWLLAHEAPAFELISAKATDSGVSREPAGTTGRPDGELRTLDGLQRS